MAIRCLSRSDRTRRWIAAFLVMFLVYLGCFNAIHKSSLASTDSWLANIEQDVSFLPPVVEPSRLFANSTIPLKTSFGNVSSSNEQLVQNQIPPQLDAAGRNTTESKAHNLHDAATNVASFQNVSHQRLQSEDLPSNVTSPATAVLTATSNIPRLAVIPKPDPLPPAVEIINGMKNETTRTNGQIMLDFAIIGFAKCGTSTMMVWLGQQDGIHLPQREQHVLQKEEAWNLVPRLYKPIPEDPLFGKPTSSIQFRAYKAPSDIEDVRPMRLLRQYFPQTKLIIGIRHPILMIESFYNHRIQNAFPIARFILIGWKNSPRSFGVTWRRAEYHGSLLHLGKTALNTTAEVNLLPKPQQNNIRRQGVTFPKMPNPVFLYDVNQLKQEEGNDNLDLFVEGLSNYLGFSDKLPPPIHEKPGKKLNATVQAERDAKKIDICTSKYAYQRGILLEIGKKVADWILNYFLQSPDVYIANPEQFRRLVERYGEDPCEARTRAIKTQNKTIGA